MMRIASLCSVKNLLISLGTTVMNCFKAEKETKRQLQTCVLSGFGLGAPAGFCDNRLLLFLRHVQKGKAPPQWHALLVSGCDLLPQENRSVVLPFQNSSLACHAVLILWTDVTFAFPGALGAFMKVSEESARVFWGDDKRCSFQSCLKQIHLFSACMVPGKWGSSKTRNCQLKFPHSLHFYVLCSLYFPSVCAISRPVWIKILLMSVLHFWDFLEHQQTEGVATKLSSEEHLNAAAVLSFTCAVPKAVNVNFGCSALRSFLLFRPLTNPTRHPVTPASSPICRWYPVH